MYELYEILRSVMPTNYKIRLHDIEEDVPNVVGIYFLDGGDDALELTGDVNYSIYNVHIQVQSDNSKAGIKTGYDYCKEVVRTISSLARTSYNGFYITDISLSGNILCIGKSKHGIPIFSVNLKIKYNGGR